MGSFVVLLVEPEFHNLTDNCSRIVSFQYNRIQMNTNLGNIVSIQAIKHILLEKHFM